MSFDRTVNHKEIQTINGAKVAVEVRRTPYACFTNEAKEQIFLRNGKCYEPSGKEIPMPQWVSDQMKKVCPSSYMGYNRKG